MRKLALAFAVVAAGCNAPGADDFHGAETEEDVSGVTGTVGDQVSRSCSTASVGGLSTQIAEEMQCMAPGALTRFASGGGIKIESSAVLPFLHTDAVTALKKVAAETGHVEINSAFRTVAAQYLLYRWYEAGRCGIAIAAKPGTSNHESARAVDLADWSSDEHAMAEHGWAHDVAGDVVHFDHLASPDLSGMDVHAFQRLWNRNHPHDRIAEDGEYGPQTAARLLESPAAGFAVGACK